MIISNPALQSFLAWPPDVQNNLRPPSTEIEWEKEFNMLIDEKKDITNERFSQFGKSRTS